MRCLIGLWLLLGSYQIANAEYKCSNEIERFGTYSLQQFEGRNKSCIIRLNFRDSDKPRRNYQFFENGLFEVYTSIKSSLGARSYYIIPASQGPQFENLGVMAKIHDSSGLTWLLDEKGNLSNDNGCRIQQSKLSDMKNEAREKSGFYIQSCPNSLVFDFGFKVGEPPNIVNPNNSISVRDHFGKNCKIKNSDVLEYDKKDRFSHKWKYKTNQQLRAALLKIPGCKDLAENFNPGSASSSSRSEGNR